MEDWGWILNLRKIFDQRICLIYLIQKMVASVRIGGCAETYFKNPFNYLIQSSNINTQFSVTGIVVEFIPSGVGIISSFTLF